LDVANPPAVRSPPGYRGTDGPAARRSRRRAPHGVGGSPSVFLTHGRSLSGWLLPPRPCVPGEARPLDVVREVFPSGQAQRRLTATYPLPDFRSPSGTGRRPCRRPRPATPLVGFVPLRRISSRGVRSTRVFQARHLPAPGFLTLLPVCSSPSRVGLSHPTNAHGVCSSGRSPLDEVAGSSPTPSPPIVTQGLPKEVPSRFQGLAPADSPFAPGGRPDPKAADALLSFHPLQGLTFLAVGRLPNPIPSCAWGP
jgi:hypothetical protein